MYGIMAAHEGHAYIGIMVGPPREISEDIHHTTGCIGLHQSTVHRPLHYIQHPSSILNSSKTSMSEPSCKPQSKKLENSEASRSSAVMPSLLKEAVDCSW